MTTLFTSIVVMLALVVGDSLVQAKCEVKEVVPTRRSSRDACFTVDGRHEEGAELDRFWLVVGRGRGLGGVGATRSQGREDGRRAFRLENDAALSAHRHQGQKVKGFRLLVDAIDGRHQR